VEVEERRAGLCSSALTPGDTLGRATGASPATKIRQGYVPFYSPSLPILLREIQHPNPDLIMILLIPIFLQQLLDPPLLNNWDPLAKDVCTVLDPKRLNNWLASPASYFDIFPQHVERVHHTVFIKH
jgi:hypothetical protein